MTFNIQKPNLCSSGVIRNQILNIEKIGCDFINILFFFDHNGASPKLFKVGILLGNVGATVNNFLI